MNEKNWREWFFIIAMCVHIITTILVLIAMLFYTGGTSTNSGAPGFSLWANSISDLGRTKAFSGKSNTASSLLYSISQIIFGIFFVPAAIILPYYFKDTKFDKWLSYVGSFCLSVGGILITIIAFRPPDIYENMVLSGIESLAMLTYLILYSIAGLHNKSFPKKYGCLWLVILVNIFIERFMMILFAVGLAYWYIIYSIIRFCLAYGFYKQSKNLTL